MHSIFPVIFTGLLFIAVSATAQTFGGPPAAAFSSCSGKSSGSDCSFFAPHGTVSGICRSKRENRLVCVPDHGRTGQLLGRQGQRPDLSSGGGNRGARPATVNISSTNPTAIKVQSLIPDSGQGSCFDDSTIIPCPPVGSLYYGQDGQYAGAQASYSDHGNGTISDHVTGLMWQQSHNEQRLGFHDAAKTCSNLKLGGHSDWRLPEIKELFSIADFTGAAGRKPYVNGIFEIRQPSADILRGDRFAATHRTEMMGQTWSSTIYSGDHWDRPGVEAAFFFNFLDGRIKQAPTNGRNGLFYRCVRGPVWGGNDFNDNRNGTVTDRASMLTWQQADDGIKRNWQQSLRYCENLTLTGKKDWRLPNVKELQSIVDYTKNDPALNQSYLKQQDRTGWFWSSTTLGDNISHATYVCFGKCTSVDGVDVHGAGAQRSDPKSGNPSSFGPMGGQRDAVRINNYARCVRSDLK